MSDVFETVGKWAFIVTNIAAHPQSIKIPNELRERVLSCRRQRTEGVLNPAVEGRVGVNH